MKTIEEYPIWKAVGKYSYCFVVNNPTMTNKYLAIYLNGKRLIEESQYFFHGKYIIFDDNLEAEIFNTANPVILDYEV